MSEVQTTEANSKSQILKSTAVFGSAQIITVLVGIFRTKILAILLGPIGVGISGLYQSVLDLFKTASGLGLGYSGVRDIAEASATKNNSRISIVILTLRRWLLFTGLAGALVAIIFSNQISQATFGDTTHAGSFALLSITLLLSAFTTSQSAILQGFRRITDMAKSIIVAAITGLVTSAFIFYFLGTRGIVLAIITTTVIELIITWFYSAKIKIDKVTLSITRTFAEGKAMVKLGFFMTVSLLASTASMYFVRSFIVHQAGLDTVGYFIAAWTISSIYISAIFNAMAADYFPRLCAVQKDAIAIKKMVNDQTDIALLLTVPLIIAMICFIDWLVPLFYSRAFNKTATILTWQLAGDFLKVLSWPLGFILLAKGKGTIFLFTEITWNILFCSLCYFGWHLLGIEVTGVAFLLAYFIYLVTIYVVVGRLVHFQWSQRVWKAIMFFSPLLLLSCLNARFLDGGIKYLFAVLLTLVAFIYSYVQLQNIVDLKTIRRKVLKKVF